MWYKFSLENNIQSLDPSKPRQVIPSGGELEVTLKGGDFYMGPNDPPKQVQVESDSGQLQTIYLLHGTSDGQLVFGEPGKLEYGTQDDFYNWLSKSGKPRLNYISCYGSKVVGTNGGAGQLINATGAVQVGTKTLDDGTKKLVFKQ